uniref:Uncharacterized protein n=1 Tax=Anopheles atroparvus TaxID=41427 RepID=A0A182J0R8_ANOAO
MFFSFHFQQKWLRQEFFDGATTVAVVVVVVVVGVVNSPLHSFTGDAANHGRLASWLLVNTLATLMRPQEESLAGLSGPQCSGQAGVRQFNSVADTDSLPRLFRGIKAGSRVLII